MGWLLFLLMGASLPASRVHRESVGWPTPTSFDNAVALIRSAPIMRWTIRALNPSV